MEIVKVNSLSFRKSLSKLSFLLNPQAQSFCLSVFGIEFPKHTFPIQLNIIKQVFGSRRSYCRNETKMREEILDMCNRCKINSSPKAFLVQLKSVHVAPVGFPSALLLCNQFVSSSSSLSLDISRFCVQLSTSHFRLIKYLVSCVLVEFCETFARNSFTKIMPVVL